jgi:hypothetical protein
VCTLLGPARPLNRVERLIREIPVRFPLDTVDLQQPRHTSTLQTKWLKEDISLLLILYPFIELIPIICAEVAIQQLHILNGSLR